MVAGTWVGGERGRGKKRGGEGDEKQDKPFRHGRIVNEIEEREKGAKGRKKTGRLEATSTQKEKVKRSKAGFCVFDQATVGGLCFSFLSLALSFILFFCV
jgi:hypothetical protein